MRLRPSIPRAARLLHHPRDGAVLDVVGPLQDVQAHAHALVPRDVAVERPHARVVCLDLEDNVPVAAQHLSVPALRVLGIGQRLAVPGPVAFGQNVHVVAVDVHRVDGDVEVVKDDADGPLAAEVVDVVLGRKFWVGLVGGEEQGGIVVGAEGLVVEEEDVVACGVGFKVKVDDLGDGGIWFRGNGEERCGFGNIILKEEVRLADKSVVCG